MNHAALVSIAALGSDYATLSDAARAWQTMYTDPKQSTEMFPNLFPTTPTGCNALDLFKALAHKRMEKGLKSHHYMALLLDPRPRMRAFVEEHQLKGSGEGSNLGNSEAIRQAISSLQEMSIAIKLTGAGDVSKVLKAQLLVYLELCFAATTVL
jgi:hypothetical protein